MKLTSEEELKAKLVQLEDQLKEKDATIKAPWMQRVFALQNPWKFEKDIQ